MQILNMVRAMGEEKQYSWISLACMVGMLIAMISASPWCITWLVDITAGHRQIISIYNNSTLIIALGVLVVAIPLIAYVLGYRIIRELYGRSALKANARHIVNRYAKWLTYILIIAYLVVLLISFINTSLLYTIVLPIALGPMGILPAPAFLVGALRGVGSETI